MWYSFIVIAFVGLLTSPSVTLAQSYPLICRGGPDMTIEARYELLMGGQSGTIVKVKFRPAGRAGSQAKPGSGQCSWLDRTLNAKEPAEFTMVALGIGFSFDLSGNGRIKAQGGEPVLALGGASVVERQGYGRVVASILKGQFFTVLVANNGQTLMVSGVQP